MYRDASTLGGRAHVLVVAGRGVGMGNVWSRRTGLLLAALTGLGTTAVTAAPGASASVQPVYVQTIGKSAHPAMAPSGLDVDPQGNVYVADTADDQVAA